MNYMEPIAVGVAFLSLTTFSSRRAESSRSSLRKRGHSLERFISEVIIREQGQYFLLQTRRTTLNTHAPRLL